MWNTSLLTRGLLLVVILLQIFHTIEAQQSTCINGRVCEAGTRCCSVGREILCCRNNSFRFWSQWYIWFGVVMFFLLLFSCLVAYRRRQRIRFQQSSAAVTAAVLAQQTRSTTYPPTVPGQMTQQVNGAVIIDAPPSYEELKIQGISSQFEAYEQKDEEAFPSEPAPPYNQHDNVEAPPQAAVITTTTATAESNDTPAPPYPGV